MNTKKLFAVTVKPHLRLSICENEEEWVKDGKHKFYVPINERGLWPTREEAERQIVEPWETVVEVETESQQADQMNLYKEQTLWIGAFRYYLGRQTYAVTDFCELLIKQWPELTDVTRSIVQREVEEAFKFTDKQPGATPRYSRLGDECDKVAWEKVRELWDKQE